MSEASELKRFGAVPQKNSGRGKYSKGDGKFNDKFIVDVKEYKESFSISRKVWAKVSSDSFFHNLEPMLLVVLGGEDEQKLRLAVLDADVARELILIVDDLRSFVDELKAELDTFSGDWNDGNS